MIDQHHAEDFLALPTIAVLGASDEPRNFGRTIVTELRARGRHVVAVHPTAATVAGEPCHPSLAAVPGPPRSVSVVAPPAAAASIVQDAIAAGVRHLWFQPGAEDNEAIAAARASGIEVIADGPCVLVALGFRDV